jgi:hypothetical protein
MSIIYFFSLPLNMNHLRKRGEEIENPAWDHMMHLFRLSGRQVRILGFLKFLKEGTKRF